MTISAALPKAIVLDSTQLGQGHLSEVKQWGWGGWGVGVLMVEA